MSFKEGLIYAAFIGAVVGGVGAYAGVPILPILIVAGAMGWLVGGIVAS